MRPSHRDNILMRMRFSDGVLARLALEELGRNKHLSVSLFRGRVTPEDSSFELEVVGLASRIKEFIRLNSTREAPLDTAISVVA